MARFVYVYFMADDVARVRSTAPRHSEYWQTLTLSGYTGGPFADRSGGLITFVVNELHRAEDALANDPFVREGLIERSWIKRWEPVER